MNARSKLPKLVRERIGAVSVLRRVAPASSEHIVFLQGIGSNASSWIPLLCEFDGNFAALAWDAPGYGDSDALPQTSPAPRHYAHALAAMLDALGLAKVALVGHRLSSLFAGSFAGLYPDRLWALVLLSPALGYGVPPGSALPPKVQARIDDLERLGPARFAARSAPRLVARPEAKPDLVARIEEAMAAVRPGGYAQAVHALASGDLVADASAIAAPTLVAVGAEDAVTPENARRLHLGLRRSGSFHLAPGRGHAPPQEAPREIARVLSTFLKANMNA